MCTVNDTVNERSVKRNISVVVLGEFSTDILRMYIDYTIATCKKSLILLTFFLEYFMHVFDA